MCYAVRVCSNLGTKYLHRHNVSSICLEMICNFGIETWKTQQWENLGIRFSHGIGELVLSHIGACNRAVQRFRKTVIHVWKSKFIITLALEKEGCKSRIVLLPFSSGQYWLFVCYVINNSDQNIPALKCVWSLKNFLYVLLLFITSFQATIAT